MGHELYSIDLSRNGPASTEVASDVTSAETTCPPAATKRAVSMADPLPDYVYTWRPYVSSKMLYKEVVAPDGQTVMFIIDPWTQRWIIAAEPVPSLLKLANGRRRFVDIIRTLSETPGLVQPVDGWCSLALELREAQLLFDNQLAHKHSGRAVYNECSPVGMHLEITNACNMTCTHCYVSSGKKLAGELTYEEICRTIDMLPAFAAKRIAISGGEPAVRKDCGDILEYCLQSGHDVDLYTNGKNFPERLATRIRALNRLHSAKVRVQVSLEGATAEANDMVRGAGSFEAALKSLENFKHWGLNRSVVIFVCLTRHNIQHVDDLIALAERFDVSMLVFSQWQRQGNASDTPWNSIAPSTEEWVSIGEKLLNYRNPRLVVTGNFYGDLTTLPNQPFSLDGPFFPKHVYFYNAFPRITPNGTIFADQLWVDPTWALGNVRTHDLDECFESAKFHGQLEQMQQRTKNIPECQTCEWRLLCEGGSPGHTYAEYGHMNKRDLFCESRIYWFNRYVDHQVRATFG